MYNILGCLVTLLMIAPVNQAQRPKDALKPRKAKRILKKIERLDDMYYIPLEKGYNINKIARSSNYESNLNCNGNSGFSESG